jgi:hypothetical protein
MGFFLFLNVRLNLKNLKYHEAQEKPTSGPDYLAAPQFVTGFVNQEAMGDLFLSTLKSGARRYIGKSQEKNL